MTGLFDMAENPSEPVLLTGQGPVPAVPSASTTWPRCCSLCPSATGWAAAVPSAVSVWLLLLQDCGPPSQGWVQFGTAATSTCTPTSLNFRS